MSVVATVHERTETFAFIEVLAGDLLDSILVVFNQVFLLRACLNQFFRRNDQVTVSSTDGASSVVTFLVLRIVGRPPPSDAVQTESVVATI